MKRKSFLSPEGAERAEREVSDLLQFARHGVPDDDTVAHLQSVPFRAVFALGNTEKRGTKRFRLVQNEPVLLAESDGRGSWD